MFSIKVVHLCCRCFLTGPPISTEKASAAISTPNTVSTGSPTPTNEDSTDEMIRKNRERMMKKMAGKSPKATSAGFVGLIS